MADNSDILAIAAPQIKRDEGCKLHAYPDPITGGHPWTIGYGATGSPIGPSTVWTQDEADADLSARLGVLCEDLDGKISWWRGLDAVRAAVLLNMDWNLGTSGLLGFHKMLAACQVSDWQTAHDQMLASAWAKQLHYDPQKPLASRPGRLATQMLTGVPQ